MIILNLYNSKKNSKEFISTVLYTVFKKFPTKEMLIEILFNINGGEIIKALFNYISKGNSTTYNNLILFLNLAIAKGGIY
jgi:hypothetical protein